MQAKEISKKSVVLAIVAFLLTAFVVTALLYTPQIAISADVNTFNPIKTLGVGDITEANNCAVDENGNVEILAGDANIVFSGLTEYGQLVKINLKEPMEQDTKIEFFVDKQWGFSEAQKMVYEYKAGETEIYFLLGDYSYIALRIDIDVPYHLESVELGSADVVVENQTSNPLWFVWAIGLGLVAAIATYFLDQKYAIVEYIKEKWCQFIAWLKKSIIPILIMGVVAVFASRFLTGPPRLSLFDFYEFLVTTALIFLGLCAAALLWSFRKCLVEKFEKVFALLLLLVGLAMIVVTPMPHSSWDTDNHFRFALESSYLGDVKLTRADKVCAEFHPIAVTTTDPMTNFLKIGMLTLAHEEVVDSYETKVSLGHLPSGIFIAISRLLQLPYFLLFLLGKVANLLVYTAACYFGLKRLKSGKLIFAIIALFPMNVFLACSYSYDYWVTALSLLGMAYFVRELQDRDTVVSTKNVIIMSFALALACIPKGIYFPLALIPFLMPQSKIKNKKVYYVICTIAFAVLMSSFLQVASFQVTSVGDTRGGTTVGPADQIAYVFSDIFGYAFMLLKYLFTEYLTIGNMKNYITPFAYVGNGVGAEIFLILLLVAFLFDKDEVYKNEKHFGLLSKIYVVLLYFGGSALVATSMYVAFTPVGADSILGCQARYIVPWIYPMLSLLSMNRIKPIIPKKYLYWSVTIGCFGLLFYNLATVFLPVVVNI